MAIITNGIHENILESREAISQQWKGDSRNIDKEHENLSKQIVSLKIEICFQRWLWERIQNQDIIKCAVCVKIIDSDTENAESSSTSNPDVFSRSHEF